LANHVLAAIVTVMIYGIYKTGDVKPGGKACCNLRPIFLGFT
jgi:hypothetical protein